MRLSFAKFILLTMTFLGLMVGEGLAQAVTSSDIRTVQPRELQGSSLLGQEILAEFNVARDALIEKNEISATELEAEEADLAARRSQLSREEFEVFANAFDQKSISRRELSELDGRNLSLTLNTWWARFVGISNQVIESWALQNDVKIVINREQAFWADLSLDITPQIVEVLDIEYQKSKEQFDAVIFAPIENLETAPDEDASTVTTNEEAAAATTTEGENTDEQ